MSVLVVGGGGWNPRPDEPPRAALRPRWLQCLDPGNLCVVPRCLGLGRHTSAPGPLIFWEL